MLRTTLARAARVHKPLIQFPDRSKPPGTSQACVNIRLTW